VTGERRLRSPGSGDPAGTVGRWRDVRLPPAADAHFPFDPNGGLGYVWHCHIIDHEDNEMMRPDAVDPLGSESNPGTPTRIYHQGEDF